MSGIAQPRFGIFSKYAIGAKDWGVEVNANFCKLDQLMHICIDGMGALPVTGTPGQQWINSADNTVNTWITGWEALQPRCGMTAWENSTRCMFVYDGSDWVDLTVIIQNKLNVSGQQVIDAIASMPASVYTFQTSAGSPGGAPLTPFFPFHVNTAVTPNVVSAYDYGTGTWHTLNIPSAMVSAGTASSGFLPQANGNGKIDASWLDSDNLSTLLGMAASAGVASAGMLVAANAAGKIDNSWFDQGVLRNFLGAAVGGTPTQAGALAQLDANGFIDASLLDIESVVASGLAADAGKIVALDAEGFIDKSLVRSMACYATEAEAIAAGINFEGAEYFNTTTKVQSVWLDDPNGNGQTGSFIGRHVRQDHITMFSSIGQTLVSGTSTVIILGGLTSNFFGNYNVATGEYTVPDTGLYMVQYQFGIGQNVTGSGHLAQGFIEGSGPVNFLYEGTQFNTSSTQVNSLSTSLTSFTRLLPAGAILTARGLQINALGTDLSIPPGLITYLSITRIA